MQALVPAAGRGSRLGALTDDRPKGLVEVAGEPLLGHVFETALSAGVEELVVVIGYEGARIVDRFGDAFRGVPIRYVHQRDRLGLAHAVLQAAPHVDGRFLLLNGDNVFADGVRPAVEADGDVVLAVEEAPPEVARTTGVIRTDGEGRVTDIVEKPADPASALVTTGCYVLPEGTFEACALVRPAAEGELQLSEAVGLLVHAGYDVATVRLGERVNVNTPADVGRAAALLEES